MAERRRARLTDTPTDRPPYAADRPAHPGGQLRPTAPRTSVSTRSRTTSTGVPAPHCPAPTSISAARSSTDGPGVRDPPLGQGGGQGLALDGEQVVESGRTHWRQLGVPERSHRPGRYGRGQGRHGGHVGGHRRIRSVRRHRRPGHGILHLGLGRLDRRRQQGGSGVEVLVGARPCERCPASGRGRGQCGNSLVGQDLHGGGHRRMALGGLVLGERRCADLRHGAYRTPSPSPGAFMPAPQWARRPAPASWPPGPAGSGAVPGSPPGRSR